MTSDADYSSLSKAIQSNTLNEIKEMLQRDDAKALLEMTDTYGDTPLLDAFCSFVFVNIDAETLEFTVREIERIGGPALVKKQLEHTNKDNNTFIAIVFESDSAIEVKQLAVNFITNVCGNEVLKKQLQHTNHQGDNFLAHVLTNSFFIEDKHLAVKTITDVFCPEQVEKQVDQMVKTHSFNEHIRELVNGNPEDVIAYVNSLLVDTPSSGLKILVTVCAMLFERGIFQHQYSVLDDEDKTQLANQGIDANWTPEKHIDNLLKSDPRQALHQVNLLCEYTDKPSLSFLNDKVFHSEHLLNIFAAPSFFNYLNKLKIDRSLPTDLDRAYDKLMLLTAQKIDLIKETQEPVVRRQKLQENLNDARSLRQLAFEDSAVCVHKDALKSSLEEFRNLYFDFFKKKIEIEQEAAHRVLIRIELKELSDLSHLELFESLAIECTRFINKSANTFRRRSAYLLKTAPLRRVTEKHSITLPESDIENLSNHNIMGGGKFDINILDGFLLDEMKVPQDSRTAILNLVRLHRNEALVKMERQLQQRDEAFVEMQRLFREMQQRSDRIERRAEEVEKRAVETEKRSELKDSLFSLQQEKTSLIMKLRESPEKERWLNSINHSMKIQTATLEDLQQAVSDLEDEILDLTELIGHEKSSSPRSTYNSDNAQTLAHGNNDDDEIEDDFSQKSLPSDEQSKYAAQVEDEMVKVKEVKPASTASTKNTSFSEIRSQ